MKYKTVIITGASSGLGEEFAHQLASDSEHLVLVARRAKKLEGIKKELSEKFDHLKVSVEALDLNEEKDVSGLCEKISDGTYEPHVLINNAGMGDIGSFEKSEWPKLEAMLQLNMVVLTRLAHAVIPAMKKQGGGFIQNVSSLASVMPIPDFCAYAATKAYVTSFTEALRLELKEDNIHVIALCPGPVHTEFSETAERYEKGLGSDMKDWAYVSKKGCVRDGLNAMDNNHATIFPGLQIKVLAACFKALPMPILRMVMGKRPRKID